MARLHYKIQEQAYELIRRRVFAILGAELLNQLQARGNYEADATVFLERFRPINAGDWRSALLNTALFGGLHEMAKRGRAPGPEIPGGEPPPGEMPPPEFEPYDVSNGPVEPPPPLSIILQYSGLLNDLLKSV